MSTRYGWWVLAPLAGVLGLSLVVSSTTRAQDGPPAPGEAAAKTAPHNVVMYWHDRAFGELNLSIAQKKADKAEMNAWLLVELATLNKRHNKEERFQKLADELGTLASDAAAWIVAEDFDAAKTVAREINARCKACHDAYED